MAWGHDTQVAHAFRRALGGVAPQASRGHAPSPVAAAHDPRFDGVRRCMADTASPMDCRGLR